MRILLGALAGAILAFACGAVIWGFAQLHKDHLHGLPNDGQVAQALSGAAHGVYISPEWPPPDAAEDTMKAFSEKYEKGPLVYVVYDPDGGPSEGTIAGKSFGVHFASALVLAILVAVAGIGNFFGRWIFVVGVAVFASLFDSGIDWVYWYAPQDWAVRMLLSNVGTWAVAGLAIAAIVKKKDV